MTKSIKLLAILYLLFKFCCNLHAQEFTLTKPQMYADFDSLVSIIEYYNPHLNIYKETMSFDVIEEIKQQRSKIENINDNSGYFILIQGCFDLIPEAHARILNLKEGDIEEYADSSRSNPVVVKPENLQRTINSYNSIVKGIQHYYSNLRNIYLPTKYIDGNYYFTRPLLIKNPQDTLTCDFGDMITHINRIPIKTFISENHRTYYDKLRWDVYNHCFYTECFLWTTNFPENYSYPFTNLTIKKKDGTEATVPLDTNTFFTINSARIITEKEVKLIQYNKEPVIWRKDSLLYVKIPSMNPADLPLYKKEISRICRKQKISNVILDVRRNGGGSDRTWEQILNLLVDKPLYRDQMLGVNALDIYQNYIVGDKDSIPSLYDKFMRKQYKIIDNNSWKVVSPDKKSIRCKGKIYVLHDEHSYSAANTLVTFALNNDQLVAVGNPIGYLSGYGIDPFVFQLPISNFFFTMHSVIHIPKEASDVESYLWNKTEIRVVPTIEYANFFAEYRMYDFIYQYEYLKKYDPYFQAVIEDINNNGSKMLKN